jgi:tagatose 6-phosphate kinase
MIVTVTPNLALDVTYELPELRPGHAHRVRAVHSRAGGKGVNVARVLASLGHDVLVLGLAAARPATPYAPTSTRPACRTISCPPPKRRDGR